MNPNGIPAVPASECHPVLSWLRRNLPTLIAGAAFAVVAGVTGRVSYLHIEALSLSLHQPPDIARIMPFGIDGLIVVGSVALLQASEDQEWIGWLCIVPGTAASLFANVESGWKYGPLAAGWAGMASIGFFVATFTLERWLKSQAAGADRAVPAVPPHPVPGPVPAGPAPAESAAPEPPEPLTPEKALLALINTGTQRDIGAMIGVSKTTVGRWKKRLEQGGTISPELAQDGPEEAPAEPRETAEDYWAEPPESRYAAPFEAVPRLRRIGELGPEPSPNGSAS
jgi:hypothetical protein